MMEQTKANDPKPAPAPAPATEPAPAPTPPPPPKKEDLPIVNSPDGTMDRADNHPRATSRKYALATRAALIQQRKALQEQIRAIGMHIAAIEAEFGIGAHVKAA